MVGGRFRTYMQSQACYSSAAWLAAGPQHRQSQRCWHGLQVQMLRVQHQCSAVTMCAEEPALLWAPPSYSNGGSIWAGFHFAAELRRAMQMPVACQLALTYPALQACSHMGAQCTDDSPRADKHAVDCSGTRKSRCFPPSAQAVQHSRKTATGCRQMGGVSVPAADGDMPA
jgi:hypothetical protein